jgi:hypothetical protein
MALFEAFQVLFFCAVTSPELLVDRGLNSDVAAANFD